MRHELSHTTMLKSRGTLSPQCRTFNIKDGLRGKIQVEEFSDSYSMQSSLGWQKLVCTLRV